MSNVVQQPSHHFPFLSQLFRGRMAFPRLRPHPVQWHATKGAALLMIIGVALGVLVAAQVRSAPPRPAQDSESSRQMAGKTIERLEAEQTDLKKQIADLRGQIGSLQEQAGTSKSTLAGLTEELSRQRIAAGMVAVKGPGIRVILDDSAAKTVPADEDPAFYLVHEYHLRDVVNLLWLSGAEAISINGERLVSSSSIYCVGSTIMVNDTRMSPPFEILAIGNPAPLDDALNNPSNLKSLKTRVKVYGIQFKTSKMKDVTLPAYNGSLEARYSSSEATQ